MVREMGGGEMKGRGEPELLSKRVTSKVFLMTSVAKLRAVACFPARQRQ